MDQMRGAGGVAGVDQQMMACWPLYPDPAGRRSSSATENSVLQKFGLSKSAAANMQ